MLRTIGTELQNLIDQGQARFAAWLAEDPAMHAAYVLGGCFVLWLIAERAFLSDRSKQASGKPNSQQKPVVVPKGHNPLQRWLAGFRSDDTMILPGLVIDRKRTPHAAWIGPTGYGKSSAVAVSRLDGKRPMIIVCPDLSDPFRAEVQRLGGVIWNPSGDGPQGLVRLDFLKGTPRDVGRRLTEAFRSGGHGVWKRKVRTRVTQVVSVMDATGEPRTLAAIADHLLSLGGNDMAVQSWVDRFADLAEDFGDSIGAGGLDCAELLRQGKTVLLEIDSFAQQGMLEDLASLALVEAKRCADQVPGGFRLVLEEAGQLGDRIDLVLPFLRAGRRRGIPVDILTQFGGDLSQAMDENIATLVLFAQQKETTRKAASDETGRPTTDFDPRNLPMFHAWVKQGTYLKRVSFAKPKPAPVGVSASWDAVSSVIGRDERQTENGRYVVEEIGLSRPVYPGLPSPGQEFDEYLARTYRDRGCLRWHGNHDAAGYGLVDVYVLVGGEWKRKRKLVHRYAYELRNGPIGDNPDKPGETLTLDHPRTCFKDCSDLTHLGEPVTRAENVRRSFRTAGLAGNRTRRKRSGSPGAGT